MSDYAFEGPKWATSTISWSFAAAGDAFSNTITGAYQATIRAALARWAQVTNLNFIETTDDAAVDIRIGWAKVYGSEIGETDFSYVNTASSALMFRPGTLVRLEDPAATALGTGRADVYQGTAATLYQTALHEIGHALGLAHSTNPAEVMYASLGPADTDLGWADIQGIQLVYGSPNSTNSSDAGVTAATAIAPATVNLASAMIPVYRFFDTRNGNQFLTASSTERDGIAATRPDLTYEGIAMGGAAPSDPNAVAVFRLFDTVTGTHFLTASLAERNALAIARPTLVAEQISFYEHMTAQTGDAPVYRFFDRVDGAHFFTSSATERATILATRTDLTPEGIAFYVPTAS